MTANEIMWGILEGMRWLTIGAGAYICSNWMGIMSAQAIFQTTRFHKEIKSQEELEEIVENEAKKLNLNPTKINATYHEEKSGMIKCGERYEFYLPSKIVFSEEIRTEKYFDEMKNREAKKLGIDSSLVDLRYSYGIEGSRKNKEGYDLKLYEGNYATKATVRHELYHILKDCHKFNGKVPKFYNWFIAEPRATLYGCFKIKL